MKIDPNVDYRGTVVYMTGPMHPIIGKSFEPTALNMSIDLLKAKIAATYTPTELEYQRRLDESAHYRKSLGHRR